MICCTVFDLDGTLIDSALDGIPALIRVARALDLPPRSAEEIRRQWGRPVANMLQTLWPDADPEEIDRAWGEDSRTRSITHPPIAGARQALELIRSPQMVCVLHTNRRRGESLEPILQAAEIAPTLFAFIQTPDDGAPPKPDPASLRAILTRLARDWKITEPRSICVVSDRVEDAWMALTCRCHFIGVLTGAATREDFLRFNAQLSVVDSIADVPRLIETIFAPRG